MVVVTQSQEKFDVMVMKHPPNKHDEQAEENQKNRKL